MNDRKKVMITGGPTNEPIDEVMKITNMSTGSLSLSLGKLFFEAGYEVCMVLNNSVYADKLIEMAGEDSPNLKILRIETTDEMMKALESESRKGRCDILIHASAVGDYKSDFSFRMEDLAEEIFAAKESFASAEDVLRLLEEPKCKLNDNSKISSYQKNLTVKLGLTPKIIARLREWYPNTLLFGCKLLENVSKEELFEVAQRLCIKNGMDFILANDLADLRKGLSARYLVNKDGYAGTKLETPRDIFEFAASL